MASTSQYERLGQHQGSTSPRRLFRDVYAALNTGDLEGHLQLSYPRGPTPVTVVSVGMVSGVMEDIFKVFFSDFGESPTIVRIEAGPILHARPEVLQGAARAAKVKIPQSESVDATSGP